MLCDLGLSRIRHPVSRSLTYARTTENYRYLAPELLASMLSDDAVAERPTEASDIYAAGMTFFELGTQQRPFSHIRSPERAAEMALNGERPRKPPTLGGFDDTSLTALWGCVTPLWTHEPAERPLAPALEYNLTRFREAQQILTGFQNAHEYWIRRQ